MIIRRPRTVRKIEGPKRIVVSNGQVRGVVPAHESNATLPGPMPKKRTLWRRR